MKKPTLLFSLSFILLLAVACGGGSDNSSSSSEPSSAGDSIGVPECDEYLTKVEACIEDHVPDDAKAMQKQTLDQMRSQWRQAASNDTAKSSLAAGCKAALDAAKASMSSFGCSW